MLRRAAPLPYSFRVGYGSALNGVLKRDARIARKGVDPRRVAVMVERALRAEKPKAVYRVGVSRAFSAIEALPADQTDAFFISMLKKDES